MVSLNNSAFFKKPETSEELRRVETRTNKAVALFLLAFIVLGMADDILLSIDAVEMMEIHQFIFIPINVLLAVMVVIAAIFKFRPTWIKHMLLTGIVLVTSVAFFAFTTGVLYLIFIPIFTSSRYFNRKIIIVVSTVTALLFTVACILNYVLDSRVEVISRLHEYSTYNSWHYFADTLIYLILPCLLAMAFISVFAVNMTVSGGRLLSEKIKSTQMLASVDAEINTAAQIQKSVLPAPDFATPDGNFDLYAYESPAKDVCGDFYDYFMLGNNVLAVIVADVSDKGMPAAMFMMSAKKVLQCALLSCHSIDDAIVLANKLICNDNQSDMFITLWMGLIDTQSGIGKYVNAGHPFPLQRHKDGTVSFIENAPDLFIGNFPDCTPKVHSFRMDPGDSLVIFTDGLTDACDAGGAPFTLDRVEEGVKCAQSGAKQTVSALVDAVHKFSSDNNPFDDITVLALHCTSLSAPLEISLCEPIGLDGTLKISEAVQNLLKASLCPDDTRRSVGVCIDEICNNISAYAYAEDSSASTPGDSFSDAGAASASTPGDSFSDAGASASTPDDSFSDIGASASTPDDSFSDTGASAASSFVPVDYLSVLKAFDTSASGNGNIWVSASLRSNAFEITFADSGIPFNPLSYDTPAPNPLQIGGLGLSFVKSLVNEISYEYKDGKNQLKMLFIWNI